MQESKRTIITVNNGENGYYLVESFLEKPAVNVLRIGWSDNIKNNLLQGQKKEIIRHPLIKKDIYKSN